MIRGLIKKVSIGLLASLVIAGLSPVLPARAALFEGAVGEACQGTQLSVTDTGDCGDPADTGRVNGALSLAINIFSLIVGIIAVIMIIIGGLKYITSAGDSNGVNSAKNTILYAVVGLIIVVLAQVIVRFVIERTKAPVTP